MNRAEEEGLLVFAPTTMAHEEAPIDWKVFECAGWGGQFMELLVKLPRTRWGERDEGDYTLLHYACYGPNVAAAVALLQSGLVDVNARNGWGGTPAVMAAWWQQPRVLEVLCAAGAGVRARTCCDSPIDDALERDGEAVRVLVANGARLSMVREGYRQYITPELVAFERGVLRCRAAVVAMLRVKRAGQLWMWDKFLLLEIAVCVWATRYDDEWSGN